MAWNNSFYFQIYFDFSGYSDMAIGMGKMLGFTYLENFNHPYIAKVLLIFGEDGICHYLDGLKTTCIFHSEDLEFLK